MSMDAPLEESHNPRTIDYESLLKETGADSYQTAAAFLREELPFVWRDAYLEMTPRETKIVRFQYGAFEYIYDDYASLEATLCRLRKRAAIKKARQPEFVRSWSGNLQGV